MAPSLSTPEALSVADHVIVGADAEGIDVAVAVCDGNGDVLVLIRSSGAPGFSAELCAAKARTAARFDNSTAALEELWSERPVYAHSLIAQGGYFLGRGGVPLRAAGVGVGAVGVSGAMPGSEEELAVAAAEAFAARHPSS